MGLSAKWTTYAKALLNIGMFLTTISLALWFLPKSIGFLIMLSISGLIVLIASPIVKFLETKIKLKRSAGSATVILFVIAVIVFLFYAVLASVFKELASLVSLFPQLYENAVNAIAEIGNSIGFLNKILPSEIQDVNNEIGKSINSFINTFVNELKDPLVGIIGNFALSLPDALINIVMCILLSYYCIEDTSYLPNKLANIIPSPIKKKLLIMKKVFVDAIGGYFKAQVKIEFWIFLLLLIGFIILDVGSPLPLALIVSFADFLPILGTGTILIPWTILEVLNHNYITAICLFVIWIAALIIRQLIQPKIVGDSVGLPPIPTVLLMFGSYYFAGLIGMIFSVPVGIVIISLYKEGMFDTTINSVLVLYKGIENFRYFSKDEISNVKE